MKNVNKDLEKDNNEYDKPVFTSKRLSWIESPWNFNGKTTAPFTTFQHAPLMREHTCSNYDYANSGHYFISSDASSHSNTSNSESNSSKDMSNHYASANVSGDEIKLQYHVLK